MTGPRQYRKRPVVITALQLRPDTWKEMAGFAGAGRLADGKPEGFWEDGPARRAWPVELGPSGSWRIAMEIPTPEGVMVAHENDYVIRGVAGELYPCKPDIFEQTYEAAEGE